MKNGLIVKKIKRDSAGFTLIELILTMAILAIISIPIISYFTEAAKHNARSRLKQNATVAAQDILEEFKNSPYSLDNYNVVCAQAPDWSHKSGPNADGTYTLTRSLDIDKHSFTVDAKITPVKGVATTGGVMAIDYKRSVIGTMDTDMDVLASDSRIAYQSAQLYFNDRYLDECAKKTPAVVPDNTVSMSIPSKLSCTIEVDAEAKGPSVNDKVVVNINYIYKYSGGTTSDGIDLSSFSYSETVASSTIVANKLSNFYIFYDPMAIGERILLKSNADFSSAVKNNQLKLFVIAQSSVASGKDKPAGYVERSPGYRLKLDYDAATPGNFFRDKIETIYTNLSQTPPEVDPASDSMLFGKLKTKPGSTDYTLVDTEEMNRIAKIDVTVRLDSKDYVNVTGSKVQN